MSKKNVMFFLIAMGIVASGVGFMVTSTSPANDSIVHDSFQTGGQLDIHHNQLHPAQRMKTQSPDSLVVKAEDLPGTFTINHGESSATNEYSHVFFNPYALLDGEQRDYGLLGIIVHIKLMDSLVDARQEFIDQGGFDIEVVKADIRKATPDAKPISINPYSLSLDDADQVVAYRVHYLLQGVYVFEYRCRMMVRNRIANLIISARGTVDIEPPELQKQAEKIFKKQRDQLLQSID